MLGLIALCLLGYCVEIFIMGAPDFKKGSDRTYYRDKDPVPFWTQFSLFAAAGVTAAYFSINWKKGLPLIKGLDARDQRILEALGPKNAKRELRKRQILAVAFSVAGIFIAALLISLLIAA
tara:strand:+ start:177 stop:539 length:363 start_codon:yes stop_codon:yes gene_type:complete